MTSSTTSDPEGARIHARAMAARTVACMPTLPARDAASPPAGVDRDDLIWEETVAPGGYAFHSLARGARLRLIDLEGDACASMLLFNAQCPVERLNVADTIKVQWNAYIGAGSVLLSDMGRVMASVLRDDAGAHDCLCGASNPAAHARKYGASGNYGPFPSARERFLIAAAKCGLGRKDVHPCINLFKGVEIDADGTTTPRVGPFEAGRAVVLRAEMDLLVIVANCPHVLDTRADYSVTPLRLTAWRGPPTPEDDPIRQSTPERQRAFLNTDDYYRR